MSQHNKMWLSYSRFCFDVNIFQACQTMCVIKHITNIINSCYCFKHTMVSLLYYSLLSLQSLLPSGDVATSVDSSFCSSSFTLLMKWQFAAKCPPATTPGSISYPCVAYFVKLVSSILGVNCFTKIFLLQKFVSYGTIICLLLLPNQFRHFQTPHMLQLLPNYIHILILCYN